MAFGLTAVPAVVVTLSFTDEAGNSTQKRVTLPWDTDLATTLANAADVADAYQAISDGVVTVSVGVPLTDDAPVTAGVGSEVENRAALSLRLVTDANHLQTTQTLEVPAPKIGIFQGTSGPAKNIVDIADALVTGLVALYRETGGVATIGDGQFVQDGATGIASGKRVHKASRKG